MTYYMTPVLDFGILYHVTNDASLTELFRYSQNNPPISNKVAVSQQLANLMYRNCETGSAVLSSPRP
jgi:hypothetical protein